MQAGWSCNRCQGFPISSTKELICMLIRNRSAGNYSRQPSIGAGEDRDAFLIPRGLQQHPWSARSPGAATWGHSSSETCRAKKPT